MTGNFQVVVTAFSPAAAGEVRARAPCSEADEQAEEASPLLCGCCHLTGRTSELRAGKGSWTYRYYCQ